MVNFVFWKDLSDHREWIGVVCQGGVMGEEELSSSGLAPPVPVWALEDQSAVPPGGEFSRRSGFGWSLGGLELEASLCFLDSCRLVNEEQT